MVHAAKFWCEKTKHKKTGVPFSTPVNHQGESINERFSSLQAFACTRYDAPVTERFNQFSYSTPCSASQPRKRSILVSIEQVGGSVSR